MPEVVFIRDNLSVPALMLQAETDLINLGSFVARQDDNDVFRLWEIAGTAHADTYSLIVGASDLGDDPSIAEVFEEATPIPSIIECALPINSGPHHWLVKAAVAGLDTWIRTGEAPAIAGRVREIIRDLDRNLPVYSLQPLGEAIEASTWAFALFGSLFTIFGAAALFLAAVGLYGVMAFSVSQRRQEMGVRMALGAERGTIMGLVLRKGAAQLGLGIALGIVMGAGMGQPLRFVLYGVEAGDPAVYGSVIVTLMTAGLVACILPARTATRTDPVVAMRSD